ncbi:MAG: acyl-CoA dehydratase activase [Thermodesulfobacteriota bacterium]
MAGIITAGFDVGSRFVKACVARDGRMAGFAVGEIAGDPETSARAILSKAAEDAGVPVRKIRCVAATGHGSDLVPDTALTFSEAHATTRGLAAIHIPARTVVDAGGLYLRLYRLNENGGLARTEENDRCAAGSGKFLEMAARAVGVSMKDVSHMAGGEIEGYEIRTNCAVFAESEIISRINAGHDRSAVLRGVISSIAERTATLFTRVPVKPPVILVGGLARIELFIELLKRASGINLVACACDPRSPAALGAALLAAENPPPRKKFLGIW